MLLPTKKIEASLERFDKTAVSIENEVVRTAVDLRGLIRVGTSVLTRIDKILSYVQEGITKEEVAK